MIYAPVPWSETLRGREWTKEWNDINFVPTSSIIAEHLAKADDMLMNDDFKAQLRVTTLSTRHLQGQHSDTQAKVDKLQDSVTRQDMNFNLDKKKFFKPAFDRIEYIEKEQEKQKDQLYDILKRGSRKISSTNSTQ